MPEALGLARKMAAYSQPAARLAKDIERAKASLVRAEDSAAEQRDGLEDVRGDDADAGFFVGLPPPAGRRVHGVHRSDSRGHSSRL